MGCNAMLLINLSMEVRDHETGINGSPGMAGFGG